MARRGSESIATDAGGSAARPPRRRGRWLKRIVLVVLVLGLAALFSALLILRSTLPATWLAEHLERETGLVLQAQSLAIGVAGRTVMREAKVLLPDSDEAILVAGAIHLQHDALWRYPLGGWRIRRIVVENPVFVIEPDERGQWNVAALAERLARLGGDEDDGGAGPLSATRLVVRQATVVVRGVARQDAVADALTIGPFDVEARLHDERLEVTRLEGRLLEGTFAGGGVIPLGDPTFASAELTLRRVELASLEAMFGSLPGVEFDGATASVSLRVSANEEPLAAEPWRAEVRVRLAGATVRALPVHEVRASLALGPRRLVMHQGEVRFADGRVVLSGAAELGEQGIAGELDAEIERLPVQPLLGAALEDATVLAGTLSGAARWRGPLADRSRWRGDATLALHGGRVRIPPRLEAQEASELALGETTLAATLHGSLLEISALQVSVGDGHLDASGSFDVDRFEVQSATATWENLPGGLWVALVPEGERLHFAATSGSLRVDGGRRRMGAVLNAEFDEGLLAGMALEAVTFRGTVGEGEVRIDEATALGAGGAAEARGRINWADGIWRGDLHVSLQDVEHAALATATPIELPAWGERISGSAAIEAAYRPDDAAVTFAVRDATLAFTAPADAAEAGLLQLGPMAFTFTYSEDRFTVSDLNAQALGGQVGGHAAVTFGEAFDADADLTWRGIQREQLARLWPDMPPVAFGAASGTLTIDEYRTDPQGDASYHLKLAAELSDGSYQQWRLGAVRGDMRIHPGRVELSEGAATLDEGEMIIGGDLHRQDDRWRGAGRLRLQRIAVRPWLGQAAAESRLAQTFLSGVIDVDGWVSLRPAAVGVAPRMEARLRAADWVLHVREMDADGAPTYEHDLPLGSLSVAARVTDADVVLGELQGDWLGGQWRGDARIDLEDVYRSRVELMWEGVDSEPAGLLWPLARVAQGQALSGRLIVRPTELDHPLEPMHIQFYSQIAGGDVAGVAANDLVVEVFAGPDRLVMDHIGLALAGGRLDGWMMLRRRPDGWYGHVRLAMAGLDIEPLIHVMRPDAEGIVGRLSGDATVVGRLSAWDQLSGGANLSLTESDLARTDVMGALYDTMNLGLGGPSARGQGTAVLRLEGRRLLLTDGRYFNRGVEVLAQMEATDLGLGPLSPIRGWAYGTARPLHGATFPVLEQLDAFLEAIQSSAAVVEIYGVLADPEARVVPLSGVRSTFERLLERE